MFATYRTIGGGDVENEDFLLYLITCMNEVGIESEHYHIYNKVLTNFLKYLDNK